MKPVLFAALVLFTVSAFADNRYVFEDFGFSVTPPSDWKVQHNTRAREQYRAIQQKYGHDSEALARQALVLLRILPTTYDGSPRYQPTFACVGLFQDTDTATALTSSRDMFIGGNTGDTVSEILPLKQGELDISRFSVINREKGHNLAFYSFRANDKLAVCSASFGEDYRAAAEQFLGSIAKHKP